MHRFLLYSRVLSLAVVVASTLLLLCFPKGLDVVYFTWSMCSTHNSISGIPLHTNRTEGRTNNQLSHDLTNHSQFHAGCWNILFFAECGRKRSLTSVRKLILLDLLNFFSSTFILVLLFYF